MSFFGQVGPGRAQDNQAESLRQDRRGSGVITDLHGKYYEQTLRGNTFAWTSPSTALNAVGTSASNVLFNPYGNAKKLSLMRVEIGVTGRQTAAGSYGLYINKVPQATAVTGTAGSAQSNYTGCNLVSTAQVFSAATLPTTPTLYRNIGTQSADSGFPAYVIPEGVSVYEHANAADLNGGTAKVGSAWTKEGALSYTATTQNNPGYISGFTNAGLYLRQAVADLSPTPPFTGAIVFQGSNTGVIQYLMGAQYSGTNFNWGPYITTSGTLAFYTLDSASSNPTTANTVTGGYNVAMFGFDASNNAWVQLNGGAIVEDTSGWHAYSSGTYAYIGTNYTALAGAFSSGGFCEFMVDTAAPTAGAFATLYNAIMNNINSYLYPGSSTLSIDLDGSCILTPGTSISVLASAGASGGTATVTYIWEEA